LYLDRIDYWGVQAKKKDAISCDARNSEAISLANYVQGGSPDNSSQLDEPLLQQKGSSSQRAIM
jgi:hypothetical protein